MRFEDIRTAEDIDKLSMDDVLAALEELKPGMSTELLDRYNAGRNGSQDLIERAMNELDNPVIEQMMRDDTFTIALARIMQEAKIFIEPTVVEVIIALVITRLKS